MPANILPLFVVVGASGAGKVVGASGAGKSAVVPVLRARLPDCLVFDKDLIRGADWDQVYGNWLRLAYGIAQGGRHTLLCGSLAPHDLERQADRGLVGPIRYLTLDCRDEVRDRRLRDRPAWRDSSADDYLAEHRRFAGWLREEALGDDGAPLPAVDTSDATVEESAVAIARWVRSLLGDRFSVPPEPRAASA
jgi:hypothetical protein